MTFDDCRELLRCEVCRAPGEHHHIVTRGAGGSDEDWNILILCRDHHTLGPRSIHKLGRASFAREFHYLEPKIREAVERQGKAWKE